jgi:hypothetical protein
MSIFLRNNRTKTHNSERQKNIPANEAPHLAIKHFGSPIIFFLLSPPKSRLRSHKIFHFQFDHFFKRKVFNIFIKIPDDKKREFIGSEYFL